MFRRNIVSGYENETLVSHIARNSNIYLDKLRQERLVDRGLPNSLLAVSIVLHELRQSTIRVVDLGGAGGHLYETLKLLYPNIEFLFTVIETPAMVKRNLSRSSNELMFTTIADYEADSPQQDLLLANSSLQYLENPILIFAHLIQKTTPKFLYVGKTPFWDGETYLTGKQKSLLRSNGPKGDEISENIFVEYEAKIIPIQEMNSILGDVWEKVFGIEEGIFELQVGRTKKFEQFTTKSFLMRK